MTEDEQCRWEYQNLTQQFLEKGFNPAEIIKAVALSYMDGGTCWVDESAFQPTGVALGCPLPDSQFSEQLHRTAKLVAGELAPFFVPGFPVFAFVPSQSYHVTLVNYSHFDCTQVKENIISLDLTAFRLIENYFQTHIHHRPQIQFQGLVLTKAGRLIVPGFAVDRTPFIIRSDLVRLVAQFSTNLPRTLHIKLGHCLRHLDGAVQQECQKIIDRHGRTIDKILPFTDIHTSFSNINGCFLND